MGEWKEIQLGALADIGSSKRIFYKEYVPIGIPFYRSKEVIEKHNGQAISNELQISIDKYNDIKARFGAPEEGDMLLTSVGTLGIPYIVQKDEKFYFKDGNLTWFQNFTNSLLNIFLYYWIISPIGKNELDMVSIGSTQPALTIRGLKGIIINTPPLPEQKAIAAVLSSLDDKIDLLHRQNKTLEAMAETLFRQWFVEEAQEDWEEIVITDLFEIRDGTHDSPKQSPVGKPLITSKHIGANRLDINNAYLISEDDFYNVNKRSKVETNDILFSMIGTIGLTYLEQSETVDYAIKNIGLFKTSQNPAWRYYTFLWINSSLGKEFIHEYRSGSTQEYIALGSLRSIVFDAPPLNLLLEFNKVIHTYFQKIKNNMLQIRTLEKLLDTLLPKLMSGEVRVQYDKEATL